jgi:hypothetical protein
MSKRVAFVGGHNRHEILTQLLAILAARKFKIVLATRWQI